MDRMQIARFVSEILLHLIAGLASGVRPFLTNSQKDGISDSTQPTKRFKFKIRLK